MRQLYIIKTGNTFPSIAQRYGDFEDWIAAGLATASARGELSLPLQVINACAANAVYPQSENCAGVVISGSHSMVTERMPWMLKLSQWLHHICMADIPVLGICFGHQLLAHTLGGQVGSNPSGLELGTVHVTVHTDSKSDPLWSSMPNDFSAHTVHYQSVLRLPAQACSLASNLHEPHHAFRWKRHVWGVQFHPEFQPSHMKAYIDQLLQNEPPHALPLSLKTAQSNPTPHTNQLLSRFASYVQELVNLTPTQVRTA